MSLVSSNKYGSQALEDLGPDTRVAVAAQALESRTSNTSDEELELNYGADEQENLFSNYNDLEDYAEFLSKNQLDKEKLDHKKEDILGDEFEDFLEEFTVDPVSPIGEQVYSEMSELMKGFDARPFYQEIETEEGDNLYTTEFEFHYDGGTEQMDAIMSDKGLLMLDPEGNSYTMGEKGSVLMRDPEGEISKGYDVASEEPVEAERYSTWIKTAEQFVKNFNSFMLRDSKVDPYNSEEEKRSDIGYIADAVDKPEGDLEALAEVEEGEQLIKIGRNDHSGNGSGARGANYAQEISTKLNRLNAAEVIDYTPDISLSDGTSEVYLPKAEGGTGFAEYVT